MFATEVIKNKRSAKELSEKEIRFFIEGYTQGSIPDYQMASLLMSIFLQGMSSQETIELTQVMLDSGEKVDFGDSMFAVDKHSTGGVGDKTSLILAPLVAACNVPVPMMSGRGLGHTGGTLDKLEAIPGFNVNQSLSDFKKLVEKHGLCFIGQTPNICPADKKIYALRDVTATVESLPLICASIMSKKIAEGIRGLVLDVKVGSGAFMKTLDEARALARGLISIGQGHNIETQAMITSMENPLGSFVGNSLEVTECLAILKQQNFSNRPLSAFSDTQELSVALASHMVAIGKKIDLDDAKRQVLQALTSGAAMEKFAEITEAQGGRLSEIPLPNKKYEVTAEQTGFVSQINGEHVGLAGIELGAGRKVQNDKIDPVSGIELHKKTGDQVEAGETIFTIHYSGSRSIDAAAKRLASCYQLSESPCERGELILESL